MRSSESTVYFGSYTQPHPFVPEAGGAGIVICGFDARSGKLERRQMIGGVLNPSYVALDATRAHVFAVSEDFDAHGTVHVFRRLPDGRLAAAGVRPAEGRAMCHVCALPGGGVCATSYADGSLAVFPFRDGGLGPCTSRFRYEGKSVHATRQESSHAHQSVVSPDGRRLYVCDLGADRIWCHAIEGAGSNIAPASPDSVTTPTGSGPRHLVFHPTLPRAYVVCELNAHLLTYDWDAGSGRLTLADEQPSLPADWTGAPSAAAIRVHPSAAALYVSNRNHDSLAAFRLDRNGAAALTDQIPAGGKTPRDFAFDPSGRWLVAANQDSDTVAIHEIDPDSGLPVRRPPEIVPMGTPVCVLFAPFTP